MKIYDCIVVGGGPAGAGAALYTARAGLETAVVKMDGGALEKAKLIENYYGVGRITGKSLIKIGIENAKAAGAVFRTDEILDIQYDGYFNIIGRKNSYKAKTVILATGSKRNRPNVKNLEGLEGRGVSYCAVCDGFFYKGKTVAVLGFKDYALHEAEYLKNLAAKVILLTNGKPAPDSEFETVTEKIKSITGENRVTGALTGDGTEIAFDGLFVAYGTASGVDFAKKLGVECDGPVIKTDAKMATAVPGVFAAGDCTGGLLQISKAVGEGAVAATSAISYLKKISKK